jgi:hypothetical protein
VAAEVVVEAAAPGAAEAVVEAEMPGAEAEAAEVVEAAGGAVVTSKGPWRPQTS